MFFYMSKIGYFLIQPSNFLAAMLLVSVILLFRTRFRRLATVLVIFGSCGLFVCGFSPAANWLILPLEDRFPKPQALGTYDGVIVLGGSVDTIVSGVRGEPVLTTSAERLTIAARLARALPDTRIIHTGGHGVILAAQATESEIAADLFQDFGIAESRVVLEDESRNTWENAVFTRDLLKPQAGQSWLLVTSAYHMPRSMGVFRAAGWSGLTAYPVDYRTRGAEDRFLWFGGLSNGLRRFDIAFREWVGMVVYWLTGRSAALFPGPEVD